METLQIDTTRTETPLGQRLPRTKTRQTETPRTETPRQRPPRQRPPRQRPPDRPLDRDPSHWTGTPGQRPPGQRPPLDIDPSWQRPTWTEIPSGQRPPSAQRPPWTENPPAWPEIPSPRTETLRRTIVSRRYASYWNAFLLGVELNRRLFVSLLGPATNHHGSVKNLLEFSGESCDRCSPILCGTAEKRNCGEGRTNESHTILIPSKLGPTRLWMTSSYQFLEAAGFLPACSRSGEGNLPHTGPWSLPLPYRDPLSSHHVPLPGPNKNFYFYYRLQRSCEGYVFTRVCLSTGGGSAWVGTPPGPGTPPWDQVHPVRPGKPPRTRYTPRPGTPPYQVHTPPDQVHTPPDQVHTPPGITGTPPRPGTPPRGGYCCGRYASYWNAFLLEDVIINYTTRKWQNFNFHLN